MVQQPLALREADRMHEDQHVELLRLHPDVPVELDGHLVRVAALPDGTELWQFEERLLARLAIVDANGTVSELPAFEQRRVGTTSAGEPTIVFDGRGGAYYQAVVFRDLGSGETFLTRSTVTSDKTMELDGVEYPVIDVEISSASHPFYTGKQRIMDSAGRVEKFNQRFKNFGGSGSN